MFLPPFIIYKLTLDPILTGCPLVIIQIPVCRCPDRLAFHIPTQSRKPPVPAAFFQPVRKFLVKFCRFFIFRRSVQFPGTQGKHILPDAVPICKSFYNGIRRSFLDTVHGRIFLQKIQIHNRKRRFFKLFQKRTGFNKFFDFTGYTHFVFPPQ